MCASKIQIIAEAGVNHNGSLETAFQLIDAAVEAGVDIVKFQTFKTENEISRYAPKAKYQIKLTGEQESQFDMVKKLELSQKEQVEIAQYCVKKNVAFLSSPFDLESLSFLVNKLDVSTIKVASGEIDNGPLLFLAAQSGRKVILSTGMSTLGDIEAALGVLALGYSNSLETPNYDAFKRAYSSEKGQEFLREKVTLLHCTTEYPTPFMEVNLKAMDTLHKAFGLSVGLSDHTQGITTAIGAAALGAVIIEKHFTLDRELPGPDHQSSLEPDELKALVKSVRQLEESLGSPLKIPTESELSNVSIVRKSLVATKRIKAGELFTESNIGMKRPGNGVSPMYYWNYLGTVSQRDYEEDEMLDE